MRLNFRFYIIFLCLFTSSTMFAQQSYKIGILAKRGATNCMKQWSATADYLSAKIPGKTFVRADHRNSHPGS